MTKRTAAVIITLVVIALVACNFINVVSEDRVAIRASIINTVRELNNPIEWQKWHPLFSVACAGGGCNTTRDSAAKSFTIQAKDHNIHVKNEALSFIVTGNSDGYSSNYTYSAFPSLREDSVTIAVVSKKSLLQVLLPFLGGKKGEVSAIDSLKSYMESTQKYYGFSIERTRVIDTNVVITNRTMLVKNRYAEVKDMFARIHAYIEANHLTITQPPIAHYYEMGNDSMNIMAGIPVNKSVIPKEGVSCMEMPKGFMLVGYYKGRFNDRAAIYTAMDKYMRDHFLQKVAATYEKYLDNKVPDNDSAEVEMEVHYPIY